ncbi:MAG: hypothetical protein BGO51_04850 [Rhodospirillales bacterium 69-11]|nr:hypothetical protein [Rhodospirillales bacterium]MBN8929684.1 hypothetical protein [Rhodospirillales bacterium]OJW19654.1 MAG: hypothetical protein BGO51_04850 [Rhodospirillales bacterium 69-11]
MSIDEKLDAILAGIDGLRNDMLSLLPPLETMQESLAQLAEPGDGDAIAVIHEAVMDIHARVKAMPDTLSARLRSPHEAC